jgi:3-methylcrotonyl-CoA carboxylase alpha subunit
MALPKRLLIANRGEIACRVARTARRLGIETVAVHSDADATALHVGACDRAVRIGAAAPAQSYLCIDALLAAARYAGADAVHPGYGFLAENPGFADACASAGLTFIGPPAAAIRAMGSKAAAKELLQQAGVPLTLGYHGECQEPGFLLAEAARIGYPVLIKASAGGGGKGMRRVDHAADFPAALASCRREAAASFGDDRILLERYVLQPRHIEIQIFADSLGHCIHLFERDCSVQRRHQKVLEEAPAPGMTPARRAAMGRAAVEAARAVGYVGAGTVEFIVAPDGEFYFMEMNTRLQVEHAVTEMITGLDLVEWQLRVAGGEALPLRQEHVVASGHAIEARICAEDPDRGFMPCIGPLDLVQWPEQTRHVRVDAGVATGGTVTPFYDAMIAKLIVWDETRELALRRLQRALQECRIAGVTSNVPFLQRLVGSRAFSAADLDTALIEREQSTLFPPVAPPPREAWCVAAVAFLALPAQMARTERDRRDDDAASAATDSPWNDRTGWRLGGRAARTLQLRAGAFACSVRVAWLETGWSMAIDGIATTVRGRFRDRTTLELELGSDRSRATVVATGAGLQVFIAGQVHAMTLVDPLRPVSALAHAEHGLRAPMPGRVVALLATPGSDVARGTPLVVLEAMKMEHTLVAPAAGRVDAFHVAAGEQVAEGAELVAFSPAVAAPD